MPHISGAKASRPSVQSKSFLSHGTVVNQVGGSAGSPETPAPVPRQWGPITADMFLLFAQFQKLLNYSYKPCYANSWIHSLKSANPHKHYISSISSHFPNTCTNKSIVQNDGRILTPAPPESPSAPQNRPLCRIWQLSPPGSGLYSSWHPPALPAYPTDTRAAPPGTRP